VYTPIKVSRETKFGYGFLLAGVGVPFLIFDIFGFNAAVIVASCFTVLGVALLIAGHRHKEERTRRGVMATIGLYTLIGLLIGISTGAIAGLAIVLKQKFRPESTIESNDKGKGMEVQPKSPETASNGASHPGKRVPFEPHIKSILSPYTRTESFIIDVPYYGGEDGFPIVQLLDDDDYPLSDAYRCVTSVLVMYAPLGSAQIKQIAALDTPDKRTEALVQILRYCLIEQIVQSERGSSKFGISTTKGSIAEYKPALLPPDSSDYPPQKLLSLLGTLPFGNDQRIQMLYQGRPLRVPKGGEVEFDKLKMDTNDWATHWVLRIRKANVFNFTVGVAPINAAVGVLPGTFPERYKTQRAKYVTYSFAVTMKIQVERTLTNGSEVDDFRHWSEGIWEAIRAKFDIKRQK
jgi:hypothetical protein